MAIHEAQLEVHVESQSSDLQKAPSLLVCIVLLSGRAAQHTFDPSNHIAHGVGLHDVVVGTQFEAANHVVFRVASGAEDDGDGCGCRLCLQYLGHLYAADFAHHDVEQDEGVLFDVVGQGLFGTGGHVHFIAFVLQVNLQHLTERLFIVDNKYSLRVHDK